MQGLNLASGTTKPEKINKTTMNENESKIVRITNISNFDFTGELGARYGGRDYFVPAGKSMLFPFAIGDHLATHLARQILLKSAPTRDASQVDGKGSDRPLWDEKSLAELKAKIMVDVYEEEKSGPVSEADRLAQKVAELNATTKEEEEGEAGGNTDASTIVPTEQTTGGTIVYKDKAEVIAELKKQGKTFDARASKAKLEELL